MKFRTFSTALMAAALLLMVTGGPVFAQDEDNMNGLKTAQDGMMNVQAYRLSTEEPDTAPVKEDCQIAVEGPVTIDVEDFGTYTVFCTPDDKRAMAVGFLFSEGVIDQVGDILLLNECIDDPDVIRIKLSDTAPKGEGHARNLLIVSSCGVCGSEVAAKPALLTHLDNEQLVLKSHPRIALRGRLDSLAAHCIVLQHQLPALADLPRVAGWLKNRVEQAAHLAGQVAAGLI